MSQRQLTMLEHLEELVDYFLRAGPISMESLGRAGDKLSKLNAVAFELKASSEGFSFDDIGSFLDALHTPSLV